MIKECKYCKEQIEFDKPYQMGAHVGNCIMNTKRISTKHKSIEYHFNCLKCNSEYSLELTENNYNKGIYKKYCTRSCANTRIISDEHKLKTSNSLKQNKEYNLICKQCGNNFVHKNKNIKCCSTKCVNLLHKSNGSKGGNISSISKKQYDSNMITYIYALCDEFNNIRYIGKANDIETRFKNHLKESKYKRTHKEKWINSMTERGLKPTHFILDECISSDWILMEEYWIEQVKAWGFKLTNGTSGGEGSNGFKGKKHTQETKDKLSIITTNYYKMKKSHN